MTLGLHVFLSFFPDLGVKREKMPRENKTMKSEGFSRGEDALCLLHGQLPLPPSRSIPSQG